MTKHITLTHTDGQEVTYNGTYWSIIFAREREECREVVLWNNQTQTQILIEVSDTLEQIQEQLT